MNLLPEIPELSGKDDKQVLSFDTAWLLLNNNAGGFGSEVSLFSYDWARFIRAE